MRLDVSAGRGAGATAVLFRGKVYGFKRGILSFIKRSYVPTHRRVRSLRGNMMTDNGFMDDLVFVEMNRDRVTVAKEAGAGVKLTYRDGHGLISILQIVEEPIRVTAHERFENGEVVERYTYSNILYNPTVDPAQLRP